ncbi:MAG: ribulose-phosphate 3-epimerase [Bacteroidales bacterium]|nr:ribulose-phosphate 3-epimerase [Bacteroidales bacterium]
MKHLLAPSILTADFRNLENAMGMLNKSNADWIHLDIMDGVFVPNITFGFHFIKAIRRLTSKPLDVHLMITQPERYFKEFVDAGADIISFHYEASVHLHRSIQAVKELGVKAAVALNPHTPVSVLEEILPDLDMVLIMSVNPGFGGQKFIPSSLNKVRKLKNMIDERQLSTLIELDGGVDLSNARELVETGVNVLVAGNAVFSSPDPLAAIDQLKAF